MKPPERIAFSKEETKVIAGTLQRYFRDELDQDLGHLPAEMLLDFISDQLGPYFYNRGLYDAQAVLAAKVEDITDALFALERQPVSKR